MDEQYGVPIYLRLSEQFMELLANGSWAAGQRLSSVRELSVTYAVNPNTLQRAFARLEQEGYLYTESTNGRFVTKDEEKLKALRLSLAKKQVQDCREKLAGLGYSAKEIWEVFRMAAEGQEGSEQ